MLDEPRHRQMPFACGSKVLTFICILFLRSASSKTKYETEAEFICCAAAE
jgi:hypothetical protein